MMRGIEQAQAVGEIEVESAETAARYLHTVLAEAALASSHRPRRVTHAVIERSFRQVIAGLAKPCAV